MLFVCDLSSFWLQDFSVAPIKGANGLGIDQEEWQLQHTVLNAVHPDLVNSGASKPTKRNIPGTGKRHQILPGLRLGQLEKIPHGCSCFVVQAEL